MALSKAINNANPTAPAPAPTPAPAPAVSTAPTASVGKSKSSAQTEAFKAQGKSIRESDPKIKEIEGTKSDKVEFLNALGDPSRPQKRREGSRDIDSYQVVGYAFKIHEDMKVPKATLKAGFKSLTDCEDPVWEDAPAGSTVYLNNYETGILIAQPQFAGRFTGGGNSVSFSVKFSAERNEPLPVLNKDGAGSIKENMILIADVAEVDGKKTYKLKEGFDKFNVLYIKRSAGARGGSNNVKSGETQANLAAAFLKFIEKKHGDSAQG